MAYTAMVLDVLQAIIKQVDTKRFHFVWRNKPHYLNKKYRPIKYRFKKIGLLKGRINFVTLFHNLFLKIKVKIHKAVLNSFYIAVLIGL